MMCGNAPCDAPNCTWSMDYMRACEARFVLNMPGMERTAFVDRVTKIRGPEAAEDLKQRVNDEWRKRRDAA